MVDKNPIENKQLSIVGADSSAEKGKSNASGRAKLPPPAVRGGVSVAIEPTKGTDAPIARRSGRIPLD